MSQIEMEIWYSLKVETTRCTAVAIVVKNKVEKFISIGVHKVTVW